MQNLPYIVGITGGSGSGKTFFLHSLLRKFSNDEVCLISQDNYYKSHDLMPKDYNGIENYDLPETIDVERYAKDIEALRRGEVVQKEEYLFNNKDAARKTLTFKPAPIIVVEGIFVFYYPEIRKQLDLKIFIDAKEHLKIKRRIIRDNNERGYDLNDVLYRWEHHIAPAQEEFIEPFKYEADLVINNNTKFDTALEVVGAYLKTKLV